MKTLLLLHAFFVFAARSRYAFFQMEIYRSRGFFEALINETKKIDLSQRATSRNCAPKIEQICTLKQQKKNRSHLWLHFRDYLQPPESELSRSKLSDALIGRGQTVAHFGGICSCQEGVKSEKLCKNSAKEVS